MSPFKNWKIFLPNYFKNFVGIGDWHMIKIQTDGCNILIAKRFDQEFQEYKIMDRTSYGSLRTEPDVVEPEGLPQVRINELKYFEQFLDQNHREFLSNSY